MIKEEKVKGEGTLVGLMTYDCNHFTLMASWPFSYAGFSKPVPK